MNQHLQKIRDFIEQLDTLSPEEKAALNKTVKNVDTDFSITEFKLDRTEKVKRTTAILLEETIEELEQKRRAVEDKNRDLEIEASLERVRARTMAMQHSTELQDAASILFQQVEALGVKSWSSGFNIFDDDKKACTAWHCSAGLMMPPFITPLTEDPTYIHFYEGSLTGQPLFVERVEGGALTAHYHYLRTLPGLREMFAELSEEGFAIPACQINHAAYFTYGYLLFITFEPVPEAHDIFRRFAKVFEQTYTRFLDLKQAEAQAREAQIQLALERVRARTMAMQHSSELGDASFVLDSQVRDLGIETWGCAFNIYGDNESTEWFSSEAGTLPAYKTPRENIFLSYYETGKQNESIFTREYAGEACVDHYEYLCTIPVLGETLKRLKETGVSFPQRQIDNVVYFKYGYVLFITLKPSPESHDIFKRFAAVFEQTYTRFLDLQKAEAQARESQFQLALERVRARTMAMHNSSELADTASVLFEQIKELGFETWSCGFCIWKKNDLSEVWMAADSGGVLPPMLIPYKEEPTHRKIYEASLRGETRHEKIWEGDELAEHYAFLQTIPSVKEAVKILEDSGLALPARQCYYVGFFNQGYLLLITKEPKDGASELSKRFASVFEQTYTRFLDLQRAETQAREAVKQASLDRVRGEIASMRTTNDLERITPLVWNELTILGIPFIRCGVFIIDEEAELIHTHLSTPDGKAIAAFALPFDTEGIGRDMLPAWRKKEMATVHWSAEEFAAYTKTLVAQGAIKSKGKYVTERPDTTLDLYFFPFSQGMLYAGNATPLTDEEKDLVQSLADAFSAAYARYDDFNKLEVAKQQVENTLADLKAAQTKLIQSEKMASLGELTAGIAHEIQNPLNFVNNFSEVNQEMIDELAEELKAGNINEALAIAGDIKQNEQKINHHGKRADGIVKGMLQHSRSTAGEKQPTNLNAIADEFLKLSYHGLRGKDKSFNAEIITHFDDSLPKVNVIPQDIGRVMLNLFNNAFYAVNQKQKMAGPDYKPTISLTTFAPLSGGWGASVRDNGVGIPDAIKEKIMQPFFTTKPTGEGTGLGLSLTYDMVVKGHGGTIQVSSVEGEGAEFMISLPLN